MTHITLIDKPEVHAVLNEGARAIDSHLYKYLKEEFCVSDEVKELCSRIEKKESEYNFATKFLYSSNEYEKQLARIVYLCHPTEQDAFVNGLYGYVMQALKQHKLPINKDKISAYQELKNLYTAYDFVQRNRDTDAMAQAIKNMQQNGVNWKIKKYLQRASEGIKEFERKIFRVLMKCQNDARLLGYNVRSRIPNAWLF